jgi:hypothetical protein
MQVKEILRNFQVLVRRPEDHPLQLSRRLIDKAFARLVL